MGLHHARPRDRQASCSCAKQRKKATGVRKRFLGRVAGAGRISARIQHGRLKGWPVAIKWQANIRARPAHQATQLRCPKRQLLFVRAASDLAG